MHKGSKANITGKSGEFRMLTMNKEIIENLLLSELEEVNGGQSSRDCHCSSGAGEIVVIEVPIESDPDDSDGTVYC